ncbi:MSCRAMM family protein [Canibacter oris]|uniref:Prealbumin-like fold domain-containing protein n=1 Tax=Canibacter oris TaxID=1365628 RepID=A0A840DMJ7_9MICO|nr:prealbumin-like fold domain-containing protein [Canibacter oris]MBB4071247.1 hypothetical protein [Canibacter oris]
MRKIFSALSITLLGLNFFPAATTATTHPAVQATTTPAVQAATKVAEQAKTKIIEQAKTKIIEQAKTKIIEQTTREFKLPGITPLPTAYGDLHFFHVSHDLTIEPGGPPINAPIKIDGYLTCSNYPGIYFSNSTIFNYSAGQTTYSKINEYVGWQPEGFVCEFRPRTSTAPHGYTWETGTYSNDGKYPNLFYDETTIDQYEDLLVDSRQHTFKFQWKLVKKPQIIDPPQLTISDPCGPNNAVWQNPPQIPGVQWSKNFDGTPVAAVNRGLAFPTPSPGVYSSYHYYGKPQDSNTPCISNIQLKMSGGRFPDTDHQFVMSWQQDSPRITNGSTSARTNIQGADPTFSVTSAPVTTSPNATGTIKISTRPRASYSRDYKTEINCYYTSSTGERVDVPAHRTDSATHFWSVTMPSTAQQTICEANVIPNFGFVSVDSFNGGYAANLTAEVIQQQQPTTGQQNWVLYPEGKTPGTVDLSKPFHGVELSQGVFHFYEHKPGIYYLELASTPEGYVPAGLQTTDTANVSKVTINTQGTRKTYFKIKVNPGETHTVPFYLQQKLGNLEFHNTALTHEGPLLEGSTWQLSGTSGGIYQQHNLTDGPLTITDCVAAAANECTGYDTDPAAGKFSIPNLEWGDYTLSQTQASPGYKLPDAHLATRQFTINQNTLQSSFTGANSFVNEYSDVPSIPHTGGLGRDHLLLSGIFVLLLAGAATVLLQRRAKHQ